MALWKLCHSGRSRGIAYCTGLERCEENSERCLGPSRTGIFARHDKKQIADTVSVDLDR
jgi:hypothetical protein